MIAVLIAFGIVSSGDAAKLSEQQAERLIVENNITKEDIQKEASVIGLEEDDM